MRVEIRDWNGCNHSIESENPATIGLWFTEWATKLLYAGTHTYQIQLIIYPTTDGEHKGIMNPHFIPLTDTLLKQLGEVLNQLS